jgi:hypothetical protein
MSVDWKDVALLMEYQRLATVMIRANQTIGRSDQDDAAALAASTAWFRFGAKHPQIRDMVWDEIDRQEADEPTTGSGCAG